MQMDQLLFQLATYETTSGLAFVPADIDEAINIQRCIAKKFNFFKRMIQNGECTLEELQQLVITRNGPVPNKNHNLSLEESLEEMLKTPIEEEKTPPDRFEFKDVLQRIMEDIAERSGIGDPNDVVVSGPFPLPPRSPQSDWHSCPPERRLENPEKPREDPKGTNNPNEKKSRPKKKGDKGKRTS